MEDGLRESALNGGERGLDLPAVVGGSVVGEGGFPERHGYVCHGITRCGLWRAGGVGGACGRITVGG